MSDKVPIFEPGDRCRMMQTNGNYFWFRAGVCGVVINKATDRLYRVFLEDGRLVAVDGCEIDHVDEEMYHNWKRIGIDTASYVKPESCERKRYSWWK